MPSAIDKPTAQCKLQHRGPPTRVRAVLMRSGTSKGLYFKREDLPPAQSDWVPYLLAAMGSPDPYQRQLDGLGGGTSTQSKVAVIAPCADKQIADIDYTFAQVSVQKASVDFSGNCGNMAAGCGPFAVAENMIKLPLSDIEQEVTIRIRNTNTGAIINSTFMVAQGYPVEQGDMVISGVAGSGAPIRLDFVRPSGAMTGKLLPTGNVIDMITIDATGDRQQLKVPVSMIDSGNPFVFVPARALGLHGNETSRELAAINALVQDIRAVASVKMGLTKTLDAAKLSLGVPKIALLAEPATYETTSGTIVDASEMDLHVRAWSMGAPHPSLQMTGAVCLASACSIPGSVAHDIVSERTQAGPLRFAQPSGILTADHDIKIGPQGEIDIKSATVYRTARRLFEGSVLINL
ncbi:hypothetical protein OIO90_000941 [Microbotryomycetes sp. JL221]|nr:hypothetical protein OIO90_000941 [Microbotryomycetes sp. JL221]